MDKKGIVLLLVAVVLAVAAGGSVYLYLKGVPVLNAFTGAHENYSTPADTADTLNYEGAAKISKLVALLTRAVANAEDVPGYVKQKPADRTGRRRTSSVYLGTLPDYAASDVEGALINGVTDDSPAAKAGLEDGDQIVEIAGRDGLKIGNANGSGFRQSARNVLAF